MSQDKHIKKHQEFLEKMRENVRDDKQKILDKLSVDLIMSSPREHLMKIAVAYYGEKSPMLKKSIDSGKRLANSILKGVNGKNKNKKS